MPTLHDIFSELKNEDLAYRLKLLGIRPRSSRKADLIDALKAALQNGRLKEIWASLEDLERATAAEICYDPSLTYNPSLIKAKYGSLPIFCKLPKKERRTYYHWNSRYATRLNLILYPSRDSSGGRIIPSDLAEQLRRFVSEPSALRVPTLKAPLDEEGLAVRQTEHEALAEVFALLRLADKGNLGISPKTGQISPAVCRNITDCLIGGDFFPPDVAYRPNKMPYEQEIGPIKSIAWARLLKTANYFTLNGSKSKLTPSGIKALSQPPERAIRHLWNKWLTNTDYDEFRRIDAIKGQNRKGHMTAKPVRRDAILSALSECPSGKWIALDKFSDFMQGAGFEFEVTRDAWKLYLSEPQYGSLGYAGCGEWNILQFRYILCVLFEYAATLGLIDVAYVHPRNGLKDYRDQWGADDLEWLSRYDGFRSFRLTNLGAYCLGMTEDFKPAMPTTSLKLTVLPSLRIRIRSGVLLPAEKLHLETWAEPEEPDTWKLDAEHALEAVERGQSAAEFAEFLSSRDDQALPDTVEAFLLNCERNGKALKTCGEAALINCRDAETATLVCAQKELHGHCHRCGETLLAVTTTQLPKFRKIARSLGLGLV
jgi:hypothetical protein